MWMHQELLVANILKFTKKVLTLEKLQFTKTSDIEKLFC